MRWAKSALGLLLVAAIVVNVAAALITPALPLIGVLVVLAAVMNLIVFGRRR